MVTHPNHNKTTNRKEHAIRSHRNDSMGKPALNIKEFYRQKVDANDSNVLHNMKVSSLLSLTQQKLNFRLSENIRKMCEHNNNFHVMRFFFSLLFIHYLCAEPNGIHIKHTRVCSHTSAHIRRFSMRDQSAKSLVQQKMICCPAEPLATQERRTTRERKLIENVSFSSL